MDQKKESLMTYTLDRYRRKVMAEKKDVKIAKDVFKEKG